MSPSAVFWQFDGPLAFQSQSWLQQQYGDSLTDHLFDEASLGAWLAKQTEHKLSLDKKALAECVRTTLSHGESGSSALACQASSSLKHAVGITKRVYLHAAVEGPTFTFKLAVEDRSGAIKVYQSSGTSLSAAGQGVVEQAFGMGRYSLKGIPETAQVLIDGLEVGRGAGSYVVSEGDHTLKIVADQFQPYEAKISIARGEEHTEEIKMISSNARLKVVILNLSELEDFTFQLDGKAIAVEQLKEKLILRPGDHVLSCHARDRESIERTINLKPGEDGKWVVNLQYDRPLWKIALKYPHPETERGLQQISIRVQSQTLRAGAWGGQTSGFQDRDKSPEQIKSQSETMNGFGFDVGFSWKADPDWGIGDMSFGVAGLNYQYFGASTVSDRVKFDRSAQDSVSAEYKLTSLSRFKTRLLWVGYQLTMWKVSPYFHTGFLYLYERGTIESEDDDGIVTSHGVRWGWEVGIDYRLYPEWIIKASMRAEAWPGERFGLQTMIGAAYAFDLFSSPLL